MPTTCPSETTDLAVFLTDNARLAVLSALRPMPGQSREQAALAGYAAARKVNHGYMDESLYEKVLIALLLDTDQRLKEFAELGGPAVKNYYTIIGRIPDEENEVLVVYAASRPDAVRQFIEWLYRDRSDHPDDCEDRGFVRMKHGTDHYIDFIITTIEQPAAIHRNL